MLGFGNPGSLQGLGAIWPKIKWDYRLAFVQKAGILDAMGSLSYPWSEYTDYWKKEIHKAYLLGLSDFAQTWKEMTDEEKIALFTALEWQTPAAEELAKWDQYSSFNKHMIYQAYLTKQES